jgi:hypothetical protein
VVLGYGLGTEHGRYLSKRAAMPIAFEAECKSIQSVIELDSSLILNKRKPKTKVLIKKPKFMS